MAYMWIYKNDNKTYVCTVKDADGVVFDLTGASITFTVRETELGAESFKRQNLAAGGDATEIEDSDLANGEFKVHIIPTNTSGLTPGKFFYDIEITTSTSKVYTVSKGTFEIIQDITYT